MIIVADSGATKTDWIKVDRSGKILSSFSSPGINPMIQTEEQIHASLMDIPEFKIQKEAIRSIHFFGAGCSSPERNKVVGSSLKKLLPHSEIYIDHDLTGAVIALCGDSPGFACILGTGSNSVFFDGKIQVKKVPSLGWVLGDEGSGAWFGKRLLRDYCYGLLPNEISIYLENDRQLSKESVLESVYKLPNPNRYLAGFMPVLDVFKNQDYVQKLLKEGFDDFIKYHIACYENYGDFQANFVGSIALYFREELTASCRQAGVIPNKFVQRPVEHIAAYLIQKHKA